MAVQASSLSVAVQSIADYLAADFALRFPGDVHVLVDTPASASEKVKSSTKHYLNLFVYRVAPSGFHAGASSNDPFFVRINALITPFLATDATTDDDSELRLIGHAIRVLQSHPVIPATVLPGTGTVFAGDFRKDLPASRLTNYRLQAVLQAPSVEELNHIWTTQGGDLPYRLSAAYEFALIPIEPLSFVTPPVPTRTAIYDVAASMDGAGSGPVAPGENTVAIPLAGATHQDPPPTNWLPLMLFARGSELSNTLALPEDTNAATIAIAGPPGKQVAVEIAWTKADGTTEVQAAQVFTLTTHRIDSPDARETLALNSDWPGTQALVRAQPADVAGAPIAGSPFANTLTLVAGSL